MKNFPWTQSQITTLITNWNAGDSATTIAAAFGISREAVIGKIYRLRGEGVQLRKWHGRPGNIPKPPKPRKQRTGIAGNAWWQAATTDQRIEQVKAGAEAGFTASMVAACFKLSRTNVLAFASNHGIRFNPDDDMRAKPKPMPRKPDVIDAPRPVRKSIPTRFHGAFCSYRQSTIDDHGDEAFRIFTPRERSTDELRF
jgi:hypothetical protein